MRHDEERAAIVRAAVRRLLGSSPAFRKLPEERRERLAGDMVRVAAQVVAADAPEKRARAVAGVLDKASARAKLGAKLTKRGGSGGAGDAVDFPAFVAALVQGTFQAVVDASIQQMEAYADLLHDVALDIDKFKRDEGDEPDGDDDD